MGCFYPSDEVNALTFEKDNVMLNDHYSSVNVLSESIIVKDNYIRLTVWFQKIPDQIERKVSTTFQIHTNTYLGYSSLKIDRPIKTAGQK